MVLLRQDPPFDLAYVTTTHLLERIARFKRPKRYHYVDELPKNSYGKVLKRKLRERLSR